MIRNDSKWRNPDEYLFLLEYRLLWLNSRGNQYRGRILISPSCVHREEERDRAPKQELKEEQKYEHDQEQEQEPMQEQKPAQDQEHWLEAT